MHDFMAQKGVLYLPQSCFAGDPSFVQLQAGSYQQTRKLALIK